MSSNDDCYFYYYSTCTKGSMCPFRHEPAALAQEVVCMYWKAGNCSRPNCIYRHLDVSGAKRKVTSCFYENQPGGCKKPHCPFLHESPKEPIPQQVVEILEKPAQKIIVNKNKMQELSHLILPLRPQSELVDRPPVKDRLGPVKPSVRDRLGDVAKVEVIEYCSDESDKNGEEEALRRDAIKTLDLRNRLPKKTLPSRLTITKTIENDHTDEEYQLEEPVKVKSVVKKVKKAKKEKKKKSKKEKKSKNYSEDEQEDLEIEETRRVISKISDSEEESGESLAHRIAAKNDLSRPGEPKQKSPKKRKPQITEGEPKKKLSKPSGDTTTYSPIGDRKLRTKSVSKDGKVSSNLDEIDKILKEDPVVAAATNSSLDIMKELDELLKD